MDTQAKNFFKGINRGIKKIISGPEEHGADCFFPPRSKHVTAKRVAVGGGEMTGTNGLAIYGDMPGLMGFDGANINGPCMVEVPDWVEGRLGRYYLYFAHHKGLYIRLAYSDNALGPWTIKEGGVLHVQQCTTCHDHVASPDVHIDHEAKVFHMLFHSPRLEGKGQRSYYASSKDGLTFAPRPDALGAPYFRAFRHPKDGMWYALGKKADTGHQLYRAKAISGPYEEGPRILNRARHTAFHLVDETLFVFYSRIGDCPEALVVSEIDISGDWRHWHETRPEGLLRPDHDFEGMGLAEEHSDGGQCMDKVCQLRDPGITALPDGRIVMQYATAGEKGLAQALVEIQPRKK